MIGPGGAGSLLRTQTQRNLAKHGHARTVDTDIALDSGPQGDVVEYLSGIAGSDYVAEVFEADAAHNGHAMCARRRKAVRTRESSQQRGGKSGEKEMLYLQGADDEHAGNRRSLHPGHVQFAYMPQGNCQNPHIKCNTDDRIRQKHIVLVDALATGRAVPHPIVRDWPALKNPHKR